MKPHQIKVGTRVRCVFNDLTNFGKTGTIVEVVGFNTKYLSYFVQFDIPYKRMDGAWGMPSSFEIIDDGLICKKILK